MMTSHSACAGQPSTMDATSLRMWQSLKQTRMNKPYCITTKFFKNEQEIIFWNVCSDWYVARDIVFE